MSVNGPAANEIEGFLNADFRRLPIECLRVDHDEIGTGYAISFLLGGVFFKTWISSLDVAKAAHDHQAMAAVLSAPFEALRSALDEAEKRGREKLRKDLLGKIAEQTATIEQLVMAIHKKLATT